MVSLTSFFFQTVGRFAIARETINSGIYYGYLRVLKRCMPNLWLTCNISLIWSRSLVLPPHLGNQLFSQGNCLDNICTETLKHIAFSGAFYFDNKFWMISLKRFCSIQKLFRNSEASFRYNFEMRRHRAAIDAVNSSPFCCEWRLNQWDDVIWNEKSQRAKTRLEIIKFKVNQPESYTYTTQLRRQHIYLHFRLRNEFNLIVVHTKHHPDVSEKKEVAKKKQKKIRYKLRKWDQIPTVRAHERAKKKCKETIFFYFFKWNKLNDFRKYLVCCSVTPLRKYHYLYKIFRWHSAMLPLSSTSS